MKTIRSSKPQATQVLNQLLATPELVTTIQALTPERLGALVSDIGLEDASELVALATTEQLVALFDDDLWINGDQVSEQFDAERFVLWLEVLFEAGESVVVERLTELPMELLCVASCKLAYVINLDALMNESEMDERYLARVERVLSANACEEWEEFTLIDRGLRGFDVLISAIFALDTGHHSFLRNVLERCCDLTTSEVEEHGGLFKSLNRLQAAEESLRGDRQERRTERGFVSLPDARAFMRIALHELSYETGRDPVTHAYFRDVVGKQRANAATRVAKTRPVPTRLVDLVGIEPDRTRPESAKVLLCEALGLLRERSPETSELRVSELAYLANVLIAVSRAQPRQLRPIEASEAVLLVCARGLELLGLRAASAGELALGLDGILFDVAFRTGFRDVLERSDDPLVAVLRQVSQLPREEPS